MYFSTTGICYLVDAASHVCIHQVWMQAIFLTPVLGWPSSVAVNWIAKGVWRESTVNWPAKSEPEAAATICLSLLEAVWCTSCNDTAAMKNNVDNARARQPRCPANIKLKTWRNIGNFFFCVGLDQLISALIASAAVCLSICLYEKLQLHLLLEIICTSDYNLFNMLPCQPNVVIAFSTCLTDVEPCSLSAHLWYVLRFDRWATHFAWSPTH